jgi:hypothetical protein
VATIEASVLTAGVPIVILSRCPHIERGQTSPQRVIVDVQVSSHPAPLLILGCSFIVALNFPYRLVQGFLGCGEQSNGDYGVAKSTFGAGEGLGPLEETPPGLRAWHGGGRMLSLERAHGVRCYT